jgi:non-specific serine/threonine protein kinase
MNAIPTRAQPTRLIGRESDLEAVRRRLLDDDARLVSLIGAAGVGKTRLALEVQSSASDAFSQGAYFIDLSAVRDATLVTGEIADGLGLTGVRSEAVFETVQQHLSHRPVLLVLDNFEHVLPAASVVADLLATCPGIKILATSREPLRLRWEHTVFISPLAVPDLERMPEVDVLAEIPSVALLLHRIRARNPEYPLSDENARVVAELCVALDGLPLALELAAARTPFLSLPAIMARVQDRLNLLRWDAADAPGRHHSLHAAISWSYDLLPAQEQCLFRELAVFAGGISLEAIEQVATRATQDVSVLDGMLSLAEKSLIQPDVRTGEGVRFQLLETMREYAWDQLERAGEPAETRTRHAHYFLALAERAEPNLFREGQRAWILRLEEEHDNLRTALHWLGESGDVERRLRLGSALGYFWWLRGYAAEGRRWLDEALRRAPEADGRLRATGLSWLSTLMLSLGELEQAESVLADALAGARRANDRELIGLVLAGLGRLALLQGDARASARFLEQAIEAYAAFQHGWGVSSTKVSLGVAWLAVGDEAAAIEHLEDSIVISRERGDERTRARATVVLAATLARRGQTTRAAPLVRECIELSRDVEDRRLLHSCVEALVGLAEDRVPPDRMARLLGAEQALAQMTGSVKTLLATTYAARSAELLTERLKSKGYQSQFAEGQQLSIQHIADLALQILEDIVQRKLAHTVEPEAPDAGTVSLSRRERAVLGLMAEGRSDREIAQVLFIAERTVRYHLTSIFNKLGADNRPQAVLQATRHGLL